jgi:hypothetical protein
MGTCLSVVRIQVSLDLVVSIWAHKHFAAEYEGAQLEEQAPTGGVFED